MGWMSNLAETYDYASNNYEEIENSEGIDLVPICHLVFQAQITVVLNELSEFVRAEVIEKENSSTITPVTQKSAIRTSGETPHPLFDNLPYIGGDLVNYYKVDEEGSDLYNKNFTPYMKQLKKWVEKNPEDNYIQKIYLYLIKEKLIEDLLKSNILKLDDKKQLNDNKIQGEPQEKAMVRFAIETEGKLIKLWENRKFQQSYVDYYLESIKNENNALCYISGKVRVIGDKHGKYIRFAGDGTKLISSNDDKGFTFRGRFDKSKECLQIGYEVSEKAHSALRWLIRKQAYKRGGYVVVTWSMMNNNIPKPTEDSEDMMFSLPDDQFDKDTIETGETTAKRLKDKILGYKASLNKDDKVIILALDSATKKKGRLAIMYYRELGIGEYLDRLNAWHQGLQWEHYYKKDKEKDEFYRFVGAPSPSDIAMVAFGNQRNAFMELDDKILNKQVERLLPCIIDSKKIPKDYLLGAYRNASTPTTKSAYNWYKCLTVACSIIRKDYFDREGEDYDMALDENIKDRSYLFGRLLAVADKIEEQAMYSKNKSDGRMSMAKRYMDVFSKRPYKIWATIEQGLKPYFASLKPGSINFYRNIINQIMDSFEIEEFKSLKPLEPVYLLGYHSQLQAFKNTKTEYLDDLKLDREIEE